ncbi:MAG: hypothetical protein ABJN69_07930 [Hellea sp.]
MTFYKKSKTSAAVLAFLSASFLAAPAAAQVFTTDVIVQGSLCVGFDCVNGESFGFDTLRLKENNLRIHFDDTSASASFPGNDWRIVANETSNGGANLFAVEDATAGRRPFTIEAGAPINTLYVEDDGDVGIKTSTPVVDLHIVEGNTPTMRLEQDGSDGFTPQTYDLAANESNFFIRDVTNGSKLFFRAKPNAPEDSIFIAASGHVGLGTDAPSEPLDVRGDKINIENSGTGGAGIQFSESGSTNNAGLLLASNRLILAIDDGGNPEMILDTDGNLTIAGPQITVANGGAGAGIQLSEANSATDGGMLLASNRIILALDDGGTPEFMMDASGNVTIQGTITTQGSCSSGCDAVFDADYDLPSIEEHAELMFDKKYLPVVGPTQTGPINLSDKVTGMLNELEKAHIYIAQVNAEKKKMQARLDAQEARLAKLEALVQ